MTDEPDDRPASADPVVADTTAGPVEHLALGDPAGHPVLFVHGSPGGCDQGELMTRFLVAAGFRVIVPSRPGYLGTPLTDANATPAQQADLELALMDSLGIDRFGLLCWSGGGPSSYLLASGHPDRVTAIAAAAAVSHAYTFAGGAEARLMEGKVGKWLIDELARHAPKSLVKSTIAEEGDLSKAELKALTEQIWDDPVKREFVLGLAATVAGRREGLDNDHRQFPEIDDLGLPSINAPTLLVHGTVDTDVPPEQSDHAAARISRAELLAVDGGTHLALWTDPTSADLQQRIVDHLREGAAG